MQHTNNEKRETIHDGGNGTTKSRKNKNAQTKGNIPMLGIIGNRYNHIIEDDRKIFKEYLRRT